MFVKYKGNFLSVTPSAVLAKYLHCLTSQVYKTSSQRWFYQAGCQVGLPVVPSSQIKEMGTSFAGLPNPLLKHRRRRFPVLWQPEKLTQRSSLTTLFSWFRMKNESQVGVGMVQRLSQLLILSWLAHCKSPWTACKAWGKWKPVFYNRLLGGHPVLVTRPRLVSTGQDIFEVCAFFSS